MLIVWTGINFEIVELNEKNEYGYVDLNGTIEFHLTTEFKKFMH